VQDKWLETTNNDCQLANNSNAVMYRLTGSSNNEGVQTVKVRSRDLGL